MKTIRELHDVTEMREALKEIFPDEPLLYGGDAPEVNKFIQLTRDYAEHIGVPSNDPTLLAGVLAGFLAGLGYGAAALPDYIISIGAVITVTALERLESEPQLSDMPPV